MWAEEMTIADGMMTDEADIDTQFDIYEWHTNPDITTRDLQREADTSAQHAEAAEKRSRTQAKTGSRDEHMLRFDNK